MKKKNCKILISACLLGEKVRYDGKDSFNAHPRLRDWIKSGKVIAICPEMAGGLPAPRPPAEIVGLNTGKGVLNKTAEVIDCHGKNVTEPYMKGASLAVSLAKQHQIKVAILKENSPSCGSNKTYDGTFSNTKIDGMGVTTASLRAEGIEVFPETQIDQALDMAELLTKTSK